MPAKFLIVCGGAGRGILQQFDALGFDRALQIDVQSDLVQIYDGRILTFGLPLDPVVEPVPNSVSSLHHYLKQLEHQWQSSHRDSCHAGEHLTCTAGECETYKRRVNHVRVAFENLVPVHMGNGMSQRPVIGRSYIMRPAVTQRLREKLQQMDRLRLPNEDNVTVWLVASTCGGTGNGIVHHVADLVLQEFAHLGLGVRIKFIRIGAVSYRSVAPSAAIATFWSVLTDYGYRRGIADEQTVAFYYIDVPDVSGNVQAREKLVSETVLALVQPHIDQQFAQLLVAGNDVVMARVGTWDRPFEPDLVYRESLRHIKAEKAKLTHPDKPTVLNETNDIEIERKPTKNQKPTEMEDYRPTIVVVVERENSTQLPPAVHVNLADVREVEQLKSNDHWRMVQQFIQQYCTAAEQRRRKQEVQINLILDDGTREKMHDDFGDKQESYPIGSAAYVARVQAAHRVMARIEFFLFGDSHTMGYIRTLQEAWNRLIPARPWWSPNLFGAQGRYDIEFKRAFDEGIDSFLTAYFTVARCIEYYDEAKKTVSQTQRELEPLDRMIELELEAMGMGNSLHAGSNTRYDTHYMLFASLDETIDGTKTWLQEMNEQTNAWSKPAEFRRVIMQGAIGLTEQGVNYKLQLPDASSEAQQVDIVNTHVGNPDAVWWQGMALLSKAINPDLDIRRFPKLSDYHFRALLNSDYHFRALLNENEQWRDATDRPTPAYVCSVSRAMGLDIYAVQGAIPGRSEEEQITQLIEQTREFVSLTHERYCQGGTFNSHAYVSDQCTHSIGLPIRVPSALMNDPAIKDIMTIMADYLVIDQS